MAVKPLQLALQAARRAVLAENSLARTSGGQDVVELVNIEQQKQ